MKLILRTFLLITGIAISSSSFAQLWKMDLAVEDGNFKRLEKLCLDALEVKELKRKPEVSYYLAQAYSELVKDEFYFAKHPEIEKLATKYIIKGKKRDKNEEVLHDKFEEVLALVIEQQKARALAVYNINKLSKAAKLFNQVNIMDSTDRYAYYMTGKCYIGSNDSASGEQRYNQLMQWYNEDVDNNVEDAEQEVEPHTYFIDKYFQKGKYDSAKHLIANGREIFGNDPKLNYYHKEVTLKQIEGIPPSNLMLEYVQEVLRYNPTEKLLLHKENSIYMYLIKNKITGDNLEEANTLVNTFVDEKVAKSSLDKSEKIKEIDVFVQKKPENVLWQLAEYFQTYSHQKSAKYVLAKYITSTAKTNSATDIADRWNIITNYAFETKSMPFASFVLQEAILKYPTNSALTQTRSKIIVEKEVIRTNVDEQAALYSLMQDEYQANNNSDNLKRLININDKYIGLLASTNRFSTAKDVIQEQIAYEPAVDHNDRLEFLAREDYYQNYFLTRTKGKDINGKQIKPYAWNGSISGCDEGSIDLEIQNKVANRINYFRRNAGVPEVLFDQATNEYCQKAALMMSSNGKLEHDPPRSWRCWSNEGAYAAKHSLIIKDANTSIAVTYIMDDKNPSAGNRRWLLYPNGKVYGHGSSNNMAVIWALDDSGSTDTMHYVDKPVTWPPEGHVPQIMLFSNWTFSVYQDLTDARVEVKRDGKPIDVKVEKFVRGYGAPTLVFQPAVDRNTMPEKSKFDVTVTLSSGRKFYYTVNTFFYNPAR